MNRRRIISSIASTPQLAFCLMHKFRMIDQPLKFSVLGATEIEHVGRCPATCGPVLALGGFGAFTADCGSSGPGDMRLYSI